jgi:hypothetical protein
MSAPQSAFGKPGLAATAFGFEKKDLASAICRFG